MQNTPTKTQRFFITACYFEASLILVAVVLGWIADINPFENLYFSENSILYGIVGTLPLFLIFIAMEPLSIASVQKIRQILFETLAINLHALKWPDFFILAAIAGIAEETLFRGILQPWMENSWGMNAGLIVSSLLFGLVHAVTPLYFVLASAVGLYLGLFLDYSGERSLLTPIVIHGLYDFLVFLAIMKAYRRTLVDKPQDPPK